MLPMSDTQHPKGKITHRVKRYGQVSATMAGMAAKLAGEKFLGLKIEREAHAAQIMQALGGLKGH